ncbi:MAG: hypothetical protein D6736_21435, partial [Nitrospinota bacterium]
LSLPQSPPSPLPMRSIGYITPEPITALGTITGSPEGKAALSSFDTVYLQLTPQAEVVPGKRCRIVRQERPLTHPLTGKRLGYLVSILGDLRIEKVEGRIATAQIDTSLDVIQVGDQIQEITSWAAAPPFPPATLDEKVEGVVVGSQAGKVNLSLYDVVYIDRGRRQGVSRGDRFTVIYPLAGAGEMDRVVEVPAGEIQVLDAQENTATALVISSRRDFPIGAKVVSARAE